MTIKTKLDKYHAITLLGEAGGELTLVKGGKRSAYLWCSAPGGPVYTFSGAKSLAALAKAITKELRRRG